MADPIADDPILMLCSVTLAIAAAGLSLRLGRNTLLIWRLTGAGVLACAVAGLCLMPTEGFSAGLSAATVKSLLMNTLIKWVATPVALTWIVTIVFAWRKQNFEVRRSERNRREAEQMRSLADAALEGLLICRDGTIVTANRSFLALAGCQAADATGNALSVFFTAVDFHADSPEHQGKLLETTLRHHQGTFIPVEVMMKAIDCFGVQHQVLAVRDTRDRQAAQERIRYLAQYDALTSLPNRRHYRKTLDQAIETAAVQGQEVAVLMLNLDRFKDLNDQIGYALGDKMLQGLAARFNAILGENQCVARDGDEFAFLARGLTAEGAGHFAHSIIAAIQQQGEGLPQGAVLSGSIGISMYPHHGLERDILLRNAISALEQAKDYGRGSVRLFEADASAHLREKRMIDYALREALTGNELRLVYQPQMILSTGTIVGFEALLRWRNPDRGEVSPALFIPIAEESGSILQIGAWVLRTACKEAASWANPLRIAVNVSAMQIHVPGFAKVVHEILLETGLKPDLLELEITETALIRDLQRALTCLRQLRALGVRIAMDDFGMGYSSLSNLRAFPFDKIKIDGSFVQAVHSNEQSAAIVRAVLGLGRGLKLPILAEGVESQEELNFLLAEGCQEAQGYLIGRPAPIDAFQTLLNPQLLSLSGPPKRVSQSG